MRLKLINYFKHRNKDNFELYILILINLIVCVLSSCSLITTEILDNIKSGASINNNNFSNYNSIFWGISLLTSFFLAEIALHDNFFELSRSITIYSYSFIFIPIGIYVSSSISIIAMYYVLCIALLNIIAKNKERFIINIFLFIIMYIYVIIHYQFPELLPPEVSRKATFIHFLIDIPLIVLITAFIISTITNTYRNDRKRIILQNTKLERIVKTDILTGLYNKSYLNEQLPLLINNAYKHKSPLSIFLIDIDFFKNYNTLYGNIKGDSCLIEVANILRKNCSNISNHIYRFGGEEFIILLPDTDPDGSRILAESIKEDFHIKQIDNYRSTICNYLTVSIGIYTYSGLFKTTTEQIIKNADNALYTVKRKGRDDYYINSSYEES